MEFILLILGMSVLAFALGWSSASIYQLNKFRKKWSAMAKRSQVFDEELARLQKSYSELQGQAK